MRKIAAITVGRSDYGLYRSIFREIQAHADTTLQLIATGAHFEEKFGSTVREIEQDGFEFEAIRLAAGSNSAEGLCESMAEITAAMGKAYARLQPDILLVLGDRFEMHAATVAAMPFRLPVAHIHGGELTFGALDDAFRHSITKLAHLHFVATRDYGARVVQMGEAPWRVTISGAPGLDILRGMEFCSREEFGARHGISLAEAPLLVTYHAATLVAESVSSQAEELLAALDRISRPILFTLPNADPGHEEIIARIREFAGRRPSSFVLANLGVPDYFSAMRFSAAMVGNSSSGIIEAASFQLPVVNVGSRQEGRVRARNVIDTGADRQSISSGIEQALSPEFRRSLEGLENPYGNGGAAAVIVHRLDSIPLDGRLLIKRFHDLPGAS